MSKLIFIVVALAVIYFIYRLFFKIRNKIETHKVVQMSLYGKKKVHKSHKFNKQSCSFCHQKKEKLTFYADEQGRPVGVCDVCRPQAERRSLTRL